MIIGVDFDGTIVEHDYPKIGADVPGALVTLKDLQERDHKLILWTMRSGKTLNDAIVYLFSKGIKFYGINKNPGQSSWTHSPKAYCNIYIDDAALGCPLTVGVKGVRPMVNWEKVRSELISGGVL